ncbi:MAG TPA: iron ABC transporter permease [Kofleriaceae bacterium]|nr:iron ABC transporter permease [Kofleriaceae bacterium]
MTAPSFSRTTGARLAVTVGLTALAAAACVAVAFLIDTDIAHGKRLRLIAWDELGTARFVDWRLPRVLAGALVGACLAGAGCTFQAVLRNPLAEPYALGVSSGASLAAFLAIHLGIDQSFLGDSGVGLAALLGAGATVALVWRLARVGEDLPPATLLLAGITIAMFCSAASMFVQYVTGFGEMQRMTRWLMGGLDGRRMDDLLRAAPGIAVGGALLLSRARALNALSAGGDAAASVGVAPGPATALAFITSSLLVGAAIALGGPIGFVGLMVPHAMRAIVGPDHRILLPCAMLAGAGFLVLCDTIARVALAGSELPVGLVTALLGGPFFLYLLLREKTRSRLWGG